MNETLGVISNTCEPGGALIAVISVLKMWRQEDKKSTVILCYITSSRSALDAWSPISKIGGGVTGCACLVDESSHEELVHLISCLKIFLLFVFCVMCV